MDRSRACGQLRKTRGEALSTQHLLSLKCWMASLLCFKNGKWLNLPVREDLRHPLPAAPGWESHGSFSFSLVTPGTKTASLENNLCHVGRAVRNHSGTIHFTVDQCYHSTFITSNEGQLICFLLLDNKKSQSHQGGSNHHRGPRPVVANLWHKCPSRLFCSHWKLLKVHHPWPRMYIALASGHLFGTLYCSKVAPIVPGVTFNQATIPSKTFCSFDSFCGKPGGTRV